MVNGTKYWPFSTVSDAAAKAVGTKLMERESTLDQRFAKGHITRDRLTGYHW
jgi:hypothetical protein